MLFSKISFRSLVSRWRQYVSLFLVCTLGVGVSLFGLNVIKGMLFALSFKAEIYYGGDFQFLGGNHDVSFYDVTDRVQKLEKLLPARCIVAPRFDYDASSSSFYFEGESAMQRVVKGVDFAREESLLSQFTYVAGDCKNMAGTNGILLSAPVAEKLNVSVGDSITFMCSTYLNWINTVQFEVRGIFNDSSLFGMYTSYVDLDYLRDAVRTSPDYCNRIGVYFPEAASDVDCEKWQSVLEKEFRMVPVVKDKNEFYAPILSGAYDGEMCGIIPLKTNMKDLQVLIDALKFITAFVIITLVVIIIVGISSTYRVIVMKRINEIGIYKAIGMERGQIFKLLVGETCFLLIAGCASGLLFSGGLCAFIQNFNFSFIPAFDIFLTNGILVPVAGAMETALMIFAVMASTLTAVAFAVQEAVRIMPVEALAVTE